MSRQLDENVAFLRDCWVDDEVRAGQDAALSLEKREYALRVLGELDAKRQLLEDLLAEKHLVVEDDCRYTCRAATEERDGGETCNDEERGGECSCGRDARVERRVRLLALPYAGADDDFPAEWRP